jgi:preprotein translocase subunit SecD
MTAVVDSNITTLIAAAVLWKFGTGPIKGFAVTLSIGILVSMFTAIVITRFLLKQTVGMKIKNSKLYGI